MFLLRSRFQHALICSLCVSRDVSNAMTVASGIMEFALREQGCFQPKYHAYDYKKVRSA